MHILRAFLFPVDTDIYVYSFTIVSLLSKMCFKTYLVLKGDPFSIILK